MSWDNVGQAASVMQLTGIDAFALVSMIVKAAQVAQRNRDLCLQLAELVEIVGGLLRKLQIPELRREPVTRRPLDQLDAALVDAFKLVRSCSEFHENSSMFSQMVTSARVASKLREAKEKINQYIHLIPFITLVAVVDSRGARGVPEDMSNDPVLTEEVQENMSNDPAITQRPRLTLQEVPESHALVELQPIDVMETEYQEPISKQQDLPRPYSCHELIVTTVKVYKQGAVGRSIDISRYSGYEELKHALARMFGIEGQHEDHYPIGWKLVYKDHEDDILLLGDYPWEDFVNCVRCIRILSSQEVLYMILDGDLGTNFFPNYACSSSDGVNDVTETEYQEPISKQQDLPRPYSYHELTFATGNFAEVNKLGQSLGNFYQGILWDGNCRSVAIKMLPVELAEVSVILCRLRHDNIMQFLGWCESDKGLLLVYERKGRTNLYSSCGFSFTTKVKIIFELGDALCYLHQAAVNLPHGDIKPSNILLYPFQLMGPMPRSLKEVDRGADEPLSSQLVAMDTGRFSANSDVYSFGIVILEIVTGRRLEMHQSEEASQLVRWIWDLYDNGNILEAVDNGKTAIEEMMNNDYIYIQRRMYESEREQRRVIHVGLWCTHMDPGARPTIEQAMVVLKDTDNQLPDLWWSPMSDTVPYNSIDRIGYKPPKCTVSEIPAESATIS